MLSDSIANVTRHRKKISSVIRLNMGGILYSLLGKSIVPLGLVYLL